MSEEFITQEMFDRLPFEHMRLHTYTVIVSDVLPGGGRRVELWAWGERRFTWLSKRKRWAVSFTALDGHRSHDDQVRKYFCHSIYGKFGGL